VSFVWYQQTLLWRVLPGRQKMKTGYFIIVLALTVLLFMSGCNEPFSFGEKKMSIEKQVFGKADGRDVYLYTLTNANGLKADITNYGGIVTSLQVPDREGNLADIVSGYDSLTEYIENNPYFGALIGRVGNRICKGKFTLNGV
jgi:aldose 1-epimerase